VIYIHHLYMYLVHNVVFMYWFTFNVSFVTSIQKTNIFMSGNVVFLFAFVVMFLSVFSCGLFELNTMNST